MEKAQKLLVKVVDSQEMDESDVENILIPSGDEWIELGDKYVAQLVQKDISYVYFFLLFSSFFTFFLGLLAT